MQHKPDIFKSCDPWLLLSVVAIVIFGLIMLASASAYVSDKEFGWPFHLLMRQLLYLGLGVGLISIVTQLKVSWWEDFSIKLLILVLLLLVLVLLPGIGHHVNGSARWVGFGPVRLQVSELVKFAMIVFIAGYLVRRQHEIHHELSGFLKPMLLLGVVGVLLLLEPDFGAMVVITASVMTMMFMAGVRARIFVGLVLGIAIVFTLLVVLEPYRMLRVVGFLHPWAHPNGEGYQLTESLIGFGRGGVLGVGLGDSVQKLLYLPEADTDFIFSVITEELGLLGSLVLIGLYALLVWRIFVVGRQAQLVSESFAAYIAYGTAIWFGMQFMVNMGVDIGALPTKGLTLPFMSYGGSSMVVDCLAIGLIFRIDYEVRLLKSGIHSRRV